MISFITVQSHQICHPPLPSFIVTIKLILIFIISYDMYLHIEMFFSLLDSPALGLCKCPQFEIEILPSSIQHFPVILFYPVYWYNYLNFDFTFYILETANFNFLNLIFYTFINIKYLNISSELPFILRVRPINFALGIDYKICRSVNLWV